MKGAAVTIRVQVFGVGKHGFLLGICPGVDFLGLKAGICFDQVAMANNVARGYTRSHSYQQRLTSSRSYLTNLDRSLPSISHQPL